MRWKEGHVRRVTRAALVSKARCWQVDTEGIRAPAGRAQWISSPSPYPLGHSVSGSNQRINLQESTRAEMLASPEALAAVRAEADGLESVPAWDEDHPREFEDVRSESRKSGIKVRFGKLMTIASIKFYELAKHLQKMKGRTVYRGDCARDEEGAAAVYRELGANPTSVQGLNACMAYGALPGHQTTTADAIKAYVQAYLKSNYQTLPNMDRVASGTQTIMVAAEVCSPRRALAQSIVRSPRSGGTLGETPKGCPAVDGRRGDSRVSRQFLASSTASFAIHLCGRSHVLRSSRRASSVLGATHVPGRRRTTRGVLGRNHYIINAPAEGTENAALGALKDAVALDMVDYAQQTVDLYLSVTGHQKLRHAPTPFCLEGSLVPSDDDVKGELAPNACKILMKAL